MNSIHSDKAWQLINMFICFFRYDPKTDMWTAVAPMSLSRDAVGVCLLGDRLYAVGGYDGQVYLNTVEAYDPQTNEWTQVYTHFLSVLTSFIRIISPSRFCYACVSRSSRGCLFMVLLVGYVNAGPPSF